jgi:hypothetical protein
MEFKAVLTVQYTPGSKKGWKEREAGQELREVTET